MTTTGTTTAGTHLRCDQCGTPAAEDQRYCLNCGAHINEAPDPVAAYFSEASAARARVAAAVARGALAQRPRRLPRLSAASAVLLVVVALLIGIAIGHSTSTKSSKPGTTTTLTTTATSKTGTGCKTGAGGKTGTRSSSSSVAKKTGKGYQQQESSLPTTVTP